MDSQLLENSDEPLQETPEDVAILYSWANLHGAKYRDFSASRREYRAQVRHRAAEETRRAELAAKAAAEIAAAEAERAARDAERAARSADQTDSASERENALRAAEEAARRAGAERVEAARRAEAAAIAEAVARREEREIAEAHASAQRQAKSYSHSEVRRRYLAGPQPTPPGLAGDPYSYVHTEAPTVEQVAQAFPRREDPLRAARLREELLPRLDVKARPAVERYRPEDEARRRPQGYRPDEASGMMAAYRPATGPAAPAPVESSDESESKPAGPAWLYGGSVPPRAPVADTLQHQRERVASRWFALKDAFEPGREREGRERDLPSRELGTPVLAIFSLAGGVGKTSLVATLGRALSSLGERVLLADTTSQGLLPYYFGASELRPGVVRTFSPPAGSSDAPIHLASYEAERGGYDPSKQDLLVEQMATGSSEVHRVLLDLNAASGWVVKRLAKMNPTLLVPVAPDMNSVISLQAVERFFEGASDHEGRTILPYYVLNGFDASLPLHLDVREVLRRQLGDRLLPFVVRRAPAVSEALAEGMTVIDYAPDAAVAGDYRSIAGWLRDLSPPVSKTLGKNRWSER
jgi:cellulose synthase operon protein YhjQ